MAVQQTNSSFSKRLGARVAQANAEHKDKAIDTGNRRLPAGIRNGVAKLQFMYTKEQTEDKKQVPKGETFFRASAVCLGQLVNGVLVKDHKGEAIDGITTSVVIPLCDIPGKNGREGKTFSQNWFEFQNLFKLLSNGSIVCPETPQTDPTGQKTEAFYFAMMAALTNPKHPIYIEFSTREWTPPASITQPKPEPMVFETWHGLAHLPPGALAPHDPAAGVNASPPHSNGAHPSEPPQHQAAVTQIAHGAAPPPTNGQSPQHQPDDDVPQDDEEYVAGLVEVAMADPECKTPDGAAATTQLEGMAWERGWSKEQTKNANDWAQVGEMALNSPTKEDLKAPDGLAAQLTGAPSQSAYPTAPTVGMKFMYAKRTKDGVKYKDNKGAEFPAQECEVLTVDAANRTVTLKTCHDGKVVSDLRTKKPVDVKFEWLEVAPPY